MPATAGGWDGEEEEGAQSGATRSHGRDELTGSLRGGVGSVARGRGRFELRWLALLVAVALWCGGADAVLTIDRIEDVVIKACPTSSCTGASVQV